MAMVPQNDIRLRTKLIIKRGSEFLVGKDLFGKLKFSPSPWDAWQTRDLETARSVARCIGGDLWLFNNVTRNAVPLTKGQDRKENDDGNFIFPLGNTVSGNSQHV